MYDESILELKTKCDIISDYYELLHIAEVTNNDPVSLNDFIENKAKPTILKENIMILISHNQEWIPSLTKIFGDIATMLY